MLVQCAIRKPLSTVSRIGYTDSASRDAVDKLRLGGTPTPRSWVARMTKRPTPTGVRQERLRLGGPAFGSNALGGNRSANLTTAQRERACGVLLGCAAGDALVASQRGAWTARAARAIPVAELAATGADLRSEVILDRLVGRRNRDTTHFRPHVSPPTNRGVGTH